MKTELLLTAATCLSLMVMSGTAQAKDAVLIKEKGPYAIDTPQYRFSNDLKEQEAQLKNNPLMKRFAASRAKFASDPYRPLYHFVSPASLLDPYAPTFWQGRWHLFYYTRPSDAKPTPGHIKEKRLKPSVWGHAVSDDLVHWRDLPYTMYPGIDTAAFYGGTVVEKDRVVAFYSNPEGFWQGNQNKQTVAISTDPLLLNWEKSDPIMMTGGDTDIWKEGDTYIGLIGSWYNMEKYYPDSKASPTDKSAGAKWERHIYGHAMWPKYSLWSSKNLKNWTKIKGTFLEKTPFTDRYDDSSCPNFQKIGDKHIMLYFSHRNGAQYFLGDYDQKAHKFKPYDHGWFNHKRTNGLGGVHCPAAASTDDGVINIFNLTDAIDHKSNSENKWIGVMSLPQLLTLDDNKRLAMAPVKAIESLRHKHKAVGKTSIPAGRELILKGISGNSMELNLEINPKEAKWVRLNILRSPDAEEHTAITFYRGPGSKGADGEIVIDSLKSSIHPDAWPTAPQRAFIKRAEENLKLQVFIDRSIIEVYVNGKQYLAARVYPGRKDSVGVSVQAHGNEAKLIKLDAWQMKPIWPVKTAKTK